MKTISEQELKDILDKHDKWVRGEEGGARANLSGADLSGADLSGADLSGADLYRAILSGAYLCGADLLTFQYQKHFAYMTPDGILKIGCIAMPVSEWLLGFEEIGKANNYSSIEIKLYGQFIKLCAEHFMGGKVK